MLFLSLLTIVLLLVAAGLLLVKIHHFKQPRTIKWQIGHQVFTFQFPFTWLPQLKTGWYFTRILAIIGAVILGILILAAVLIFLFLFLGLLLPIILVIILAIVIFVLIFEI